MHAAAAHAAARASLATATTTTAMSSTSSSPSGPVAVARFATRGAPRRAAPRGSRASSAWDHPSHGASRARGAVSRAIDGSSAMRRDVDDDGETRAPSREGEDGLESTGRRRREGEPRAGEMNVRRRRAREIQDEIGACESAWEVLDVVARDGEGFNAVNSVTAMYRISRLLTSRAGRLRRSEAKHIAADSRFATLLEMVEGGVQQLDKVGLEHRRWAYHKLALPSEYRMRAALSIRLLDRAKDLQGDLMDAADVEFILTMVEEQEEVFNKVNASTALHRVARLTTQTIPGKTKSADRTTLFGDARFQTLMNMVDRMACEMSMQGVSNALWALARLDYPTSPAMLESLAARASLQASTAEAKNLSTTLWALAVLGHKPRSKLLKAVADRSLVVAKDFRSPDVVNMLWAYARWTRYLPPSDKPTPVVVAMLDQAVSTMSTFSPYQLANLSWSLAMLDCPPAPRVLEYILNTVANETGKLDGTALTHVLWAFGVMGSPTLGASADFAKLLREAGRRAEAGKVGRTGAAGVLWACGRLGVEPDSKDTARLVNRIYSKDSAKPVDPQALVHSVWGVSTFERYNFDASVKDLVIKNISALKSAGSIGPVHVKALRDSAADAGIDLQKLDFLSE
jgi:hypothetical protein